MADINKLLNKLIDYAENELMLDTLDETYTLNKLAELTGVVPERTDDECGDATLAELLRELKAACKDIDADAVCDALMPLPHTVNYYFTDEFSRKPEKAFDFLFKLYADGGYIPGGAAIGADGFVAYGGRGGKRPITLNVGGDDLIYSPVAAADRVATLECPDILSEDIATRLVGFAESYGGVIAKRIGDDGEYFCCKSSALESAKIKKNVSSGVVKTELLDYPVPALMIHGIAKNAVAREAARIIKTANADGVACVAACTVKDGVKFFVVFAKDAAKTEIFTAPDALAACGVFETAELEPLLSVLEKGTALSSDLYAFKPLYAEIGGVKHGNKAADALGAELAKQFKAHLAAAASVDEAAAEKLAASTDAE